jgi:hypothetical protein
VRAWRPGDAAPTTVAEEQPIPYAFAVDDQQIVWSTAIAVFALAKP